MTEWRACRGVSLDPSNFPHVGPHDAVLMWTQGCCSGNKPAQLPWPCQIVATTCVQHSSSVHEERTSSKTRSPHEHSWVIVNSRLSLSSDVTQPWLFLGSLLSGFECKVHTVASSSTEGCSQLFSVLPILSHAVCIWGDAHEAKTSSPVMASSPMV